MVVVWRRVVVLGMLVGAVLSGPVGAQKSPVGSQDNGGMNGSLSRSDLEKLGGDHGAGRTSGKAKGEGKKIVAELQLPCEVNAAQVVVSGTRRLEGKEVPVHVYEVGCAQGMGYLLETQGAAAAVSISCLTAEEARAGDVAQGKEPGFFCRLAENRDLYGWVAALIASGAGGARCTVQGLQWLGRSDSAHSEYSEVACEGGKGYVLGTALPGSGAQAKAAVMSCGDAARLGVRCRLTDSGPAEGAGEPSLETLKAALARHVSCKIDPVRLIGQEEHLKRYVVEYRCADAAATRGIAFVPLEGNTNPYESLDCGAGALQGIACVLPAGAN